MLHALAANDVARLLQEAAAARAEMQQRQAALAADEARAMEDLAAAGKRLEVLTVSLRDTICD